MSRRIVNGVIVPLCLDLGARYLRSPEQWGYDDEEKTLKWGLGYKKHGDKRMRTDITFQGIQYRDGDRDEGRTRETEMGRRIGWSRKHDNRLVQNDETVVVKIAIVRGIVQQDSLLLVAGPDAAFHCLGAG